MPLQNQGSALLCSKTKIAFYLLPTRDIKKNYEKLDLETFLFLYRHFMGQHEIVFFFEFGTQQLSCPMLLADPANPGFTIQAVF